MSEKDAIEDLSEKHETLQWRSIFAKGQNSILKGVLISIASTLILTGIVGFMKFGYNNAPPPPQTEKAINELKNFYVLDHQAIQIIQENSINERINNVKRDDKNEAFQKETEQGFKEIKELLNNRK